MAGLSTFNVCWLPMSVRPLMFRGHTISKTQQERPIVTMEHCYEVGTVDSVAAFVWSEWGGVSRVNRTVLDLGQSGASI